MTQVRIDQLEKQNREIREEAERKLKEVREKYEGVIRKYNDKDEECKRQGRELTQLKRKISICETEFHKLESAREQHKSQQANSLKQIADLQRRKSEVERSLNDKESNWLKMHERLKTAEQEKEKMSQILDALKEDMKSFKEQKEKEATEFNEEIVRLMQELRVKRSEELNERKKRMDSIKASESIQMEMLENVKNKKEELMAEIESQKILIGKLDKKKTQLEKDNRKWENLYAVSQKENQKLQNDAEDWKKQITEAEKSLKKAESEKVDLGKDLSKIKSQFDNFKAHVDKKMKEKTHESENSLKSNGDLKTMISELEKKCEKLNQTIDELQKQDVKRLSDIELLKSESVHALEVEKIRHEKTQKEVEKLHFQKSSLALQVKGLSERLAKSQKEINENRGNSASFADDKISPDIQSSPIEDPVSPVKIQQELLEHKLESTLASETNIQNLQKSPQKNDFATNFANGIADLTNDKRTESRALPSGTKLPINTRKEFRDCVSTEDHLPKPLSQAAPDLKHKLNFEMSEMFEPNMVSDSGLQYESLANQTAIYEIMGRVDAKMSGGASLYNPFSNERPDNWVKRSGSNHEEHSERVQQTPLTETPLTSYPMTLGIRNPEVLDTEKFPNRMDEENYSRNMEIFSPFEIRSTVPNATNYSDRKQPPRKFELEVEPVPNSQFLVNTNSGLAKEKPDFLELKPPSSEMYPSHHMSKKESLPRSREHQGDRDPRKTNRGYLADEKEFPRFLGSGLQSFQEPSAGVIEEISKEPQNVKKTSSPVRENRQRQRSFDECSNISRNSTVNETSSFRSSQTSLLSTGSQDVYDNIQTMIQNRQEKYRNRRCQSSRWSGTQSLDDAAPEKRERPEVRPRTYSKRRNPDDVEKNQTKNDSKHNLSNGYYSSCSEIITKHDAGSDRESDRRKLQSWEKSQEQISIVENENQKLKNQLKSAHAKVAALEIERKETDELIQRMSDSALSENIAKRKLIGKYSGSIPGRKNSRIKLQEDLEIIEKELMIAIKHQELLENRITAQDNGRKSNTAQMYGMQNVNSDMGARKHHIPVLKKPLLDYVSNAAAQNRSLRKFNSLARSPCFRADVF